MGCTPLIRVLLILNEKRRIEKMKFERILKKYDIKIFKNEKISESIYKEDFLKLQLLTERDCKNGSKKSC
jgi:hypothetical protein